MNLAQAIRLGCTMSKPRTGYFVVEDVDGPGTGFHACALGAAAIAIGIPGLGMEDKCTYRDAYTSQWPELAAVNAPCPADCGYYSDDSSLYDVITHLNDFHDWAREDVADWLDEQVLDLVPVTVQAVLA